MPENNFIKSVEFKKGEENLFPPFKGGDKIYFGGEKQVQKLIEFYLKSKPEDSYEGTAEDNAKRFKINCVLGNNGGGKSRLFDWLYNFFYGYSFEDFTKKSEKYSGKINIGKNKIIFNFPYYSYDGKTNEKVVPIYKNKDFLILLDDFFKLSGNIEKSVNKDLLEQSNYNNFYINLFEFYKNNKEIKQFIGTFCNIGSDFKIKIIVNGEKNKKVEGITTDIQDILKILELLPKILDKRLKEYLLRYICNLYFLVLNRKSYLPSSSPKVKKLLMKYKEEFTFIGVIIGKLDNLIKDDEEYFPNYITNLDNIVKNELLELSEFKNYDLEKSDLQILYNFDSDIIKYMFKLDIEFINGKIKKSFNNLSSGEKIILSRFINIFFKLNEQSKKLRRLNKKIEENKSKGFKFIEEWNNGLKQKKIIILIDEPDLHLHLDWQKKYIQKLIDVFSTLDTNIKLHFIIATHSPFIISDLPTESIIVLDGSKENKYGGKFTEIIDNYEKKYGKKTFGANFVDLINDGFFFENKVLMGSFAESVIGKVAKLEREKIIIQSNLFDINLKLEDEKNDNGKRKLEKQKEKLENKLKEIKKILKENLKENIGDEFLKDNLLYFIGNKNAKN